MPSEPLSAQSEATLRACVAYRGGPRARGELEALLAERDRYREERDRAVETRENANAVSVRVEFENRRLREALERIRDAEWPVDEDGVAHMPDYAGMARAALDQTQHDPQEDR